MIVNKNEIKETSDLDKLTALAMLEEFRGFSESKKSLINLLRGLNEKHVPDLAKMVREKIFDLLEKDYDKQVMNKIHHKS